MHNTISIFLGVGLLGMTAMAGADDLLLDIFPPSTVPQASSRARLSVTREFYPSGSTWGPGLKEERVFLGEVKSEQDRLNSYSFRIGKGGQIYSLRGAFGESVPPSNLMSPWNDEIWQFVSVCCRYNFGINRMKGALRQAMLDSGYDAESYFIHNSGTYVGADAPIRDFYCPLLAYDEDPEHGTVRTLNWGIVPKMKTIHRSPILYYGQFRALGNGVIEMTWMVHNLSMRPDIVFDHLNAPWGGTRVTSLPVHRLAAPDGTLLGPKEMEAMATHNGVDVRKTGGWNLSSADKGDSSPSLALVYGRDRHLERERANQKAGKPSCQFASSIYKDWDAVGPSYGYVYQDWKTRPDNDWRNYQVAVVIPKFRILPHTTIWYRSYFVVGGRKQVIEQAKKLVGHVDYGLRIFDPAKTPRVYVRCSKDSVSCQKSPKGATFALYAHPVPESMPLFLLKDKRTGKLSVTSDLYSFVDQKKLDLPVPEGMKDGDFYRDAVGYDLAHNNTEWKALLGYAPLKKSAGKASCKRVDEVLPTAFRAPITEWNPILWVETLEQQ